MLLLLYIYISIFYFTTLHKIAIKTFSEVKFSHLTVSLSGVITIETTMYSVKFTHHDYI